MSDIRGRVKRLEHGARGDGPLCPGCGWNGPIPVITEFYADDGSTLHLQDSLGHVLPDWPAAPSCELCRGEIRFVVFATVAAQGAR